MIIRNRVSAKPYNTFNLESTFNTFIEVNEVNDLTDIIDTYPNEKFKIIGGGSNILLSKDIQEPVLYLNLRGKRLLIEEDDYVLVEIASGEDWHETVLWAVEKNYGGIENLSLIPGKCGASPMQNIGAYGVELKDILHSVNAFSIKEKVELTFLNQECALGYRTSNFKTKWKDLFVITSIILRLTKTDHKIETSYGAIKGQLEISGKSDSPSIKDVSDAVIAIRSAKLPDPNKVGNAGSFFKNPIIPIEQFTRLKSEFPHIVSYSVNEELIKVPAGWLIDQCGWKGKIVGETGTYKNQALVLVNHGQAKGHEIYKLSEDIAKSVKAKFGIDLEREVNHW